TASGVVGRSGGSAVRRGDADYLGHDTADLGWRIELAFALTALRGEVPHEEFVGVAEDVVVLGAVLGEVQLRLLEDGDEVGELLYASRAVAEFIGVVKIRKIAAGQAGIGVDERLDHLFIDLVPDIAVALEGA